jgi:succinoglycan biosynthesis protein ExoM
MGMHPSDARKISQMSEEALHQADLTIEGHARDGENRLECLDHVCVCICTFKRPALLAATIGGVLAQTTKGRFSVSIVVVDNDCQASAYKTVELLQRQNPDTIAYFIEPEQNIALARNRAVENVKGNFVAFIDDDEIPEEDWLIRLHVAILAHRADGILGPVKPRFEIRPRKCILKARIFERPTHRTGQLLEWRQTRTGNALIRREVLKDVPGLFSKEFGSGGEDRDFFRRAMNAGKTFVWCNEATVYEIIPAERLRLSFQLRRALLRGKVSFRHPSFGTLDILKSFAACALYAFMLPLLFITRRHLFIRFVIKEFDHIGKILAFFGIDVINEKYILS